MELDGKEADLQERHKLMTRWHGLNEEHATLQENFHQCVLESLSFYLAYLLFLYTVAGE